MPQTLSEGWPSRQFRLPAWWRAAGGRIDREVVLGLFQFFVRGAFAVERPLGTARFFTELLLKGRDSMKIANLTTSCLLTAAWTLCVCQPWAQGATIFVDAGDGYVEFRAGWTDPQVHPSFDGSGGQGWFLNTGEWFGDGLTSSVMPFQLPAFGAVNNPFLSAELGVHLFEVGTATVTNADLYAVRVDPSPALAPTDYYSSATSDPNATLIQAAFMTPSSIPANPAAPNIFTDSSGSAALLDYLNTAYAGGANAGKYVFLRLSYAADGFAADFDAYKVTSRNAGGGDGDYPVITFTTDSVPGDTNNNGIVEFEADFGPIRDNWLETNDSFGMPLARTDGDLNIDGIVGIADFREWKDAFNGPPELVASAFAALSVPEPCGVALAVVMGLSLMVGYRNQS